MKKCLHYSHRRAGKAEQSVRKRARNDFSCQKQGKQYEHLTDNTISVVMVWDLPDKTGGKLAAAS